MMRNKKISSSARRFDSDMIKYDLVERLANKEVKKTKDNQEYKEQISDTKETKEKIISNKNYDNNDGDNNDDNNGDNDDDALDSLNKLSQVANWERQLRLELDFKREIQAKEIERQREILKNEWRKLEERDKFLRIELDSRERKLFQKEESLKNNLDEINKKEEEIIAREKMINEIVKQRTKEEISEEKEKLKKKFYQLEQNKISLSKKEEKLKDAELKLHEQAVLIKEKIEKKKDNEIELAKLRKEYEIMKKENDVLKDKLEQLQDYQAIKFENISLRSELKSVKESLKNKIFEFDTAVSNWEKLKNSETEKYLKLKMEYKKFEQEHLLTKQKHQGEINEWSQKYEQIKNDHVHYKDFSQQLARRNKMLTKELNDLHDHFVNISKVKHTRSEIDVNGCHFCNHSSKDLHFPIGDYHINNFSSESAIPKRSSSINSLNYLDSSKTKFILDDDIPKEKKKSDDETNDKIKSKFDNQISNVNNEKFSLFVIENNKLNDTHDFD